MVLSMTGFGKSTTELNDTRYSIDIKSVNSRNADINVRLPQELRAYELEIRKIIANQLQRGKIDVYINTESSENTRDIKLNLPLIQNYMQQMQQISQDISIEKQFEAAMRLPDVATEKTREWEEQDWHQFQQALQEALQNLKGFRKDEGLALENDFKNRVDAILNLLNQVEPFEKERIVAIKERMQKTLDEVKDADQDRFEQELIFYTEKLDITEEKIRLKKHCEYFLETMHLPESNGKKLNFITQEMGREINTLGSKANHAELQKIVVEMKDELEKIKEQILNVL